MFQTGSLRTILLSFHTEDAICSESKKPHSNGDPSGDLRITWEIKFFYDLQEMFQHITKDIEVNRSLNTSSEYYIAILRRVRYLKSWNECIMH